MDFAEYRAKIVSFHKVFGQFGDGFPEPGKDIPAHLWDFCKDGIFKSCRSLMINSQAYGGHYFSKKQLSLYHYIDMNFFKPIYDVNLLADIDTLEQQAEALKNEIITIGKALRDSDIYPEDWNHFAFTDFIRTSGGKVVYPFEYWEDCAEVFMAKHLSGHSNEKIAKECGSRFKTSTSNTQRARLKLVADMLTEAGLLIEAVLHNQFPPKVLSGSKQPSMRIKG